MKNIHLGLGLQKFIIIVFLSGLFLSGAFAKQNSNRNNITEKGNPVDSTTFSMDTVCGNIGDTVFVNLFCNDFNNVEYFLGRIKYDPNVIKFVDIIKKEIYVDFRQGFDGSISTFKYLPKPTTLPDGDTLFKLSFVIKGDMGENSPLISFYNIAWENGESFVDCNQGMVCVKTPNGLYLSTDYCGSPKGVPNSILNMKVFNGIPPYRYILRDSSGNMVDSDTIFNEQEEKSITELFPGNYNMSIIDSNFDTLDKSIFISEMLPFGFDTIIVKNECFDKEKGSIEFKINNAEQGDYSSKWSNNTYNQNIIDWLDVGDYGLTITQTETGCQLDTIITIESEKFDVDKRIIQDVTCYGNCDGSIEVRVDTMSGEDYRFEWTEGSSSSKISDLCAGYHDVKIISRGNCILDKSYYVSQPKEINVELDSVFDITFAESFGAIYISMDSDNYYYKWQGPNNFTSNEEDIDSLVNEGSYILTATNKITGCSVDTIFRINKYLENVNDLSGQNIRVYPIPADSKLYIDFKEPFDSKIVVYDITGKVRKDLVAKSSNKLMLDFSDLKNGLYILKIEVKGMSIYKKLIMNR